MPNKIQIRRDTLANWSSNNPVLASGEIVFVSDNNQLKVGDGSSNFNNLAYLETSTINTKTDSYTLAIADANEVIEMNSASANNLTIPLNSTVAFPIGTTIDVIQYGVGQTTLVATSGVTIRSKDNALKITNQYSGVTLYKRATNEWVAIGDLTV